MGCPQKLLLILEVCLNSKILTAAVLEAGILDLQPNT